MEYISKSPEETEKIAFDFSKNLKNNDIVCFFGGMGAGKTAFTRGAVKALGISDRVTSPTFSIVNEYNGENTVFHFDMYRVEDEDSLYSTGFYDYMDRDGILFIEWSENILPYLPKDYYKVTIDKISENERKIIIKKADE
ncbi:MAG: tRNA (adenosine(37)-N6)-threonylcarbamoyltransferase complex ATPase subunit type 1 TsaE [Clostridia bacterium]|nr:tRNA (adenosine(37)-N6)-threonylcarbamoyltransferase complex ATPase subunit type 1 TsaE [Clostridia bacterium]